MLVNTNKYKSTFSIVTMFFILILSLAVLVSVFILKDVANDSYKGNIKTSLDVEELNDGWYDVTNEKVEFVSFGETIKQEKLVLEHSLEFANETMDSFAFSTYFSVVTIETIEYDSNNQEVVTELKKYGDLDDFAEDRLLGNYYLVVHIPHDVDRSGTIRITFDNLDEEIVVFGFKYGSEGDITKNLIYQQVPAVLIFFLAVIFFVVLFALRMSKRTRNFIVLTYLHFTLFFLCAATWVVLDSQLLTIIGLPAGSVSFSSYEFYMILPLSLLLYTNSTCRWKKVGKVFSILLLILISTNFMAVNFAVFMGFHTFQSIIYSSHIVFALVILNSIIQVLANWIKALTTNEKDALPDRKYMGFVFLGNLIFGISVVAQICYSYFVGNSVSNTQIAIIGLIIYGILIIFSIINRINEGVENDKKESLNKIWEEKQKVENIRSIMNEAFRTIIPEQYIEEVIEAYRKKNIIKNNSEDGTVPEEDMILKIGHSRRLATILVSDVRGFSEISSKYDQRVGDMLSHYLGTMTDIVEKYGGHVLEFMGDGILAGFGTIEQDKYQADNAVKAAIEMQNTMKEINRWNEENGFPGQLEIGIGINTGNVFAGIIGSLERFKFDVLGREVNLASRIESFTTGGQILIAQKTKESIIEPVGTYDIIKATPKGFDTEQTYYLVNAVGDMKYEIQGEDFTPFKNPIDIKFSVFEDKGNVKKTYSGTVIEMSEHAIVVKSAALLDIFDIVKVIHNGGVTCKVTKIEEKGYTFRFTSSNKRNDGKPIFEEIEEEPNQYSDLDAETRKLMKKKKDNYSF